MWAAVLYIRIRAPFIASGTPTPVAIENAFWRVSVGRPLVGLGLTSMTSSVFSMVRRLEVLLAQYNAMGQRDSLDAAPFLPEPGAVVGLPQAEGLLQDVHALGHVVNARTDLQPVR